MPYDYSVVVPAYNEANTLMQAVERLHAFLSSQPECVEIIIVENGSTDDTSRVAQWLEYRLDSVKTLTSSKGKGQAIIKGWLESDSDILMFIDADLSPSPEVLPRLYKLESETRGVACADRFLKESYVERSFGRKLVSRIWTTLVATSLPLRYMDYQCGAKAIHKDNLERIKKETTFRDWCFDLELLLWHKDNKKPITRVWVDWKEETLGGRKSKLPILKTSFDFLKRLIQLRKQRSRCK